MSSYSKAHKLAVSNGFAGVRDTDVYYDGDVFLVDYTDSNKRLCMNTSFIIVKNGLARFATGSERDEILEI